MSTLTASRPSHLHSSDSLRVSTLKKDMSITQTYYLAHKARGKLSREAAQPDHDLRLLVGHANLLDSLMIELADAEREQERWFNQSVRGATKTQEQQQQRRVQWADQIVEEEEYEESDSDSSDDDSEYDEDDVEMYNAPSYRTLPAAPAAPQHYDDIEEDDLEEDYAQLELVRTHSHTSPPPELLDADEDSSEDESMPPSPPQPALTFGSAESKDEEDDSESEQQEQDSFYQQDRFYVPSRNPARLVSAISVY